MINVLCFLQSTLDLQAYYVATVPLAMYVGSFITSFAMKPLNKVLGRKLTFILGGIIGISGCLWITFCTKDDENVKYYVYFATSLIGIGGSTMMVTSLSLVNYLLNHLFHNIDSSIIVK